MISEHINNPKSILYHVKKYLDRIAGELKGKVVVDIPSGKGATSEILMNHGAKVIPFDLFPEYFKLSSVRCERANIMDGIPMEDGIADMLICQEGIEHFSDQLYVFKEFNRILKPEGRLIITTPSYSNLAAKFNYLLFESETNRVMPPNEIDDIWMSDKALTNEIYHGHIFLVGLQRLRIIGMLAGLKIEEIKYVRLSKWSLFLFPFFYPLILFRSFLSYFRHMKKDKNLSINLKKKVYKEQLMINISPKNLLGKHTFIVYKKEKELSAVDFRNEKKIVQFNH